MRIFPRASTPAIEDHNVLKVVRQRYGPTANISEIVRYVLADDVVAYRFTIIIRSDQDYSLRACIESVRTGRAWSYSLYTLTHTAVMPHSPPE